MRVNKQQVTRYVYYIVGMLVLALGLILNTNAGLGSSPIISVPYTLSFLLPMSFSDLTLVIYIAFVFVQFLLKGEQRQWIDVLQIPLSIVFTRFMGLFSAWFDFADASLGVRIGVLTLGVLCTGIGAALTVDMNLIPNPGDGFVQAVSMRIQKELGTTKNIVDVCCVVISLVIGFVTEGRLLGVGLGTAIAMVGVGRVIAAFNHLFRERLQEQTSLA